jgi:NAD(P)-dependent dehydrogenase (short-subunit alcohol dehydrogenase family)
MDLELAGKTALVTGASGDIGAACATALAREGVRVRVTGRDEARLAALVAAITAQGGAAEAIAGDLTDAAFLAALMAGPGPDLFVHSAGHRFALARFHAADPADAALTWKLEVEAFSALAAWALPEMMGRRFGRIVAIGSLAAHTGANGSTHYAGAKAAVEGLVRSIAAEYGRFRITANAVAPGFVETSRLGARAAGAFAGALAASADDHRASLARATVVKRLARPEEIADPVAFLCSPRAAYITGVTLRIAGGADLHSLW